MSRLKRVTGLTIAASIALAGCSSSSPEEPPSSPAESSPTSAESSESPEEPEEASPSETEASESEPESEPEVAVAAATGQEFSGSGYSFIAPEGWDQVPDGEIPQGLDISVVDMNAADGFADNVNVNVSPAGEVTPDEVESEGVAELEGAGATEVRARARVTVAGSESAHLSAVLSAGEGDYRIEQFYLTNDGQTYFVTFSFSPSVEEADRDEISMSVLTTWSWN